MNEVDHMLTLTHATERDVDLLLVEEMKCSPPFIRWFTNQVAVKLGQEIGVERSTVTHSKRRLYNRREIDITLSVYCGDRRTILLVENKLDTSEQPRQAESYREEAVTIVARSEADAVFTVLVCPDTYARSYSIFASKFDCVMGYEAIAGFLNAQAEQERGELAASGSNLTFGARAEQPR